MNKKRRAQIKGFSVYINSVETFVTVFRKDRFYYVRRLRFCSFSTKQRNNFVEPRPPGGGTIYHKNSYKSSRRFLAPVQYLNKSNLGVSAAMIFFLCVFHSNPGLSRAAVDGKAKGNNNEKMYKAHIVGYNGRVDVFHSFISREL